MPVPLTHPSVPANTSLPSDMTRIMNVLDDLAQQVQAVYAKPVGVANPAMSSAVRAYLMQMVGVLHGAAALSEEINNMAVAALRLEQAYVSLVPGRNPLNSTPGEYDPFAGGQNGAPTPTAAPDHQAVPEMAGEQA